MGSSTANKCWSLKAPPLNNASRILFFVRKCFENVFIIMMIIWVNLNVYCRIVFYVTTKKWYSRRPCSNLFLLNFLPSRSKFQQYIVFFQHLHLHKSTEIWMNNFANFLALTWQLAFWFRDWCDLVLIRLQEEETKNIVNTTLFWPWEINLLYI